MNKQSLNVSVGDTVLVRESVSLHRAGRSTPYFERIFWISLSVDSVLTHQFTAGERRFKLNGEGAHGWWGDDAYLPNSDTPFGVAPELGQNEECAAYRARIKPLEALGKFRIPNEFSPFSASSLDEALEIAAMLDCIRVKLHSPSVS